MQTTELHKWQSNEYACSYVPIPSTCSNYLFSCCPQRHVYYPRANAKLYHAIIFLSPNALITAIFGFCNWCPLLLHGTIGRLSSWRIQIWSRLSRSVFLNLAPQGAGWVEWAWLCWPYNPLIWAFVYMVAIPLSTGGVMEQRNVLSYVIWARRGLPSLPSISLPLPEGGVGQHQTLPYCDTEA